MAEHFNPDDIIKQNTSLQKKVRDYVEYTLKENERGGVYFRFKSKKFPLSTVSFVVFH